LPDPSVSYAYYIESVETRAGPQEHAAGLKQTIPWIGKLARRGDIRAEEARAEYERYQAVKLDLFYEIKEIYYELYYLRSAIELTRDNMELLAQFERVARARYRVAAASHPDVVRAQVELGRIEDRLRGLEDLRRPLAASLNAVLNRASGSSVPWPIEVSAPRLDFADDEVLERARRTNPRLRALDRDIERDRYAERLARLDFIPDFTLGVDYIVTDEARMSGTPDSGQDAVIGRVSFNVPLWFQKYTAAEREAVNRRAATTRRRDETVNAVASEVERALYDVRDAGRKIELFRDSLIPKAEESLRASLRGFESGRLGFLDLLDAERVLLEFQLLERRAISHEAQGIARLQMLAGDDLAAAAPGGPAEEAVR
jgi:outer membrane protein TolC